MENIKIEYKCDDITCYGHFVYNEVSRGPQPSILLIHAWKGQDNFIKEKAEAYAKLGYVTMAVDLYGEGKTAKNDEEAFNLMLPLFMDRNLLRKRILAAYETFIQQKLVNKKFIGAIGYCFGGLTAIELIRSGVDVKAISIHGLLGYKIGEHIAPPGKNADLLKGSLLILHGHDDPLVSKEDLQSIQNEFTDAKIDWQLHIYSNTKHAFTNPEATNSEGALSYNPVANERAWKASKNYFEEKLK